MSAATGSPSPAEQANNLGSASWLAEQALVGALLHQPDRLEHIGTWLNAHDIGYQPYRAVYVTLQLLRAAGELPMPGADAVRTVHGALVNRRLAGELEYEQITSTLDELLHAGQEVSTARCARYGRIVLEASARRRMEDWGLRMESAATTEATADGDLTTLHATQEAMVADLEDLRGRFQRSTGTPRLGGVPNLDLPDAPAAVPSTPPPRGLVVRAERQVIQAVITDPWWSRSGLIERLRPEDFRGSPAHATTWRAIQVLESRNEPIDPVMVAWTAERLVADPQVHEANLRPGLTPSDLASMRDAPVGDVHRAVTTVVRSALSHHARQARVQISAAAAAHPTSLDQALTVAAAVTSDLRQTASRLTRTAVSPISRALGGYPDPLSGGVRRVR